MKKSVLLVLMLAAVAWAQQPGEMEQNPPEQQVKPAPPPVEVPRTAVVAQSKVERQEKADYSDINCSGFLTRTPIDRNNVVAGGWDTPHATKFQEREFIYLEGAGYQEGQLLRLVRELRSLEGYKLFSGQKQMVEAAGQPYADMGRARIVGLKGKIAIAQIEFACRDVVPGDIAMPFAERPQVTYMTRGVFDRFPQSSGKARGRIVLAEDFSGLLGARNKVYLSIGGDKGLKPGDVLRVLRDYDPDKLYPEDAISLKASTTDDAQKNEYKPTKARMKQLPTRALGELVVLNVTPTSSTAMVTFSLEAIQVGDTVELE